MKLRINWQTLKADPLHWFWILVYTVGIGTLMSILSHSVRALVLPDSLRMLMNIFVGMVHVVAGGVTIEEAVLRFSGKPVPFWSSAHTLIPLSLILVYVVAPLLWATAFRVRARVRGTNPPIRAVLRIASSLAVGCYALIPLLLVGPISPWISLRVYNSMHSNQTVQANRDVMISELSDMAMQARILYLVAPQDGGCGGRWKNIRGRTPSTLTLDELRSRVAAHAGVVEALYPQQPSWYSLEVASEDSIVITGVSNQTGDDPSFLNANGTRGRIQTRVAVTPKELYWTWQNES